MVLKFVVYLVGVMGGGIGVWCYVGYGFELVVEMKVVKVDLCGQIGGGQWCIGVFDYVVGGSDQFGIGLYWGLCVGVVVQIGVKVCCFGCVGIGKECYIFVFGVM